MYVNDLMEYITFCNGNRLEIYIIAEHLLHIYAAALALH